MTTSSPNAKTTTTTTKRPKTLDDDDDDDDRDETMTTTKTTTTKWCAVCLEHLSEGNEAALDGCFHRFCYECIKRWTKTSRKNNKTLLRNSFSREEHDDDDDTLRCPTCRNAFREIRMSRTKEVKYKRRLLPQQRMSRQTRRRRRRTRETKEERKTRREKERKEGERKDFSDDEEEDLTSSSSCAEEEEEDDDDERNFYRVAAATLDAMIENGDACSVCREFDADDGGVLLLCDGCERAMHPLCVGFEEATYVPEGDFLCPECHRVAMRHANVRVRNNEFERKYVEFYTNRRRVIRENRNNNNRNNNRNNSGAHAVDVLSSSEDDEFKIL